MPKKHLPLATDLLAGGIVTRADLVTGGVDDDLGDRLVREGTWTRLAPSVYLAGTTPPTDAQLVDAARAHLGQHVVVTGLVACRALGMQDVPEERVVEVVIPPGTRGVSSRHLVVHQSARPLPTWRQRGTAYALPTRAVVDGARRCRDVRTVRALVLGAVAQGWCSAEELSAEVEAGAQRGSALMRRAVDDALAGAWSAPEAEAAALLRPYVRRRRLPPFALNAAVLVAGRQLGRPDGWLLGTGVGWQVDSRRHHAAEADFDATLAVHDRYAEHGLTLLHVTPKRLRTEGDAWARTLVAAARGRGRPDVTVLLSSPPQDGRERRPAA